jgi:hypothetical protein
MKLNRLNCRVVTLNNSYRYFSSKFSFPINSYLAGLFEGDGHIWLPKDTLSKKHNPRFCVTFNIKDLPLAEKLLAIIGFGFIRIKQKENACVLTISPVNGLIKVVNLINGQMRTPKFYQLNLLINWLNSNHGANINCLPLNSTSLNDNTWLTGFIDADGNFDIRMSNLDITSDKKRRIACRFRLDQRIEDPKSHNTYLSIMSNIADFFKTNVTIVQRTKPYFNITASSRVSLALVINYFNMYPLKSSKYLDYINWHETVNLLLTNKHYTLEGISIISNLKKTMNNTRTEFNWTHLDYLTSI